MKRSDRVFLPRGPHRSPVAYTTVPSPVRHEAVAGPGGLQDRRAFVAAGESGEVGSGGRSGVGMAPKSGKNIAKARAQVEARPYSLEDAVGLLQKVKFAKFDETVA